MGAAAGSMRGGIDPDAAAYIARFTVEPDSTRKNAINDLFIAIKTAGVYSKLDMLFVPKKAQDSQSGLLDLKRHSGSASITGSASWDFDLGFVGVAGSGNYVNTNYTPFADHSGGVTANNFGLGAYVTRHATTSPSVASPGVLVAYGSAILNRTALVVYGNESTSSLTGSFIHGSGDKISGSTISGDWFFYLARLAKNDLRAYKNASQTSTNTTNNEDRQLSNASIRCNVSTGNGTTGQPSASGAQWAGEPLTEVEQSALKLALDNYFSAL